jgi:hypothetical protein
MDSSYPSPVKSWFAHNSDVSMPFGLVLALITFPFAFMFGLVVLSGSALLWFDDLMLFAAVCFATLACLLAWIRYRGTQNGRAWAFITLGMALMAFGEGSWAVMELLLKQDPSSPAVPDIGYLGFYPAVFIGILTAPHAPVTGLRRVKLGLDLIVAIGALALISHHFVISDLINTENNSALTHVILVSYPVCDLALAFATFDLVARASRGLTMLTLTTLALGFISIAVADSLYTYTGEVSVYSSGNFLDLGWVIGYLLIAVAALLESGRQWNLDAVPEDAARPLPFWQTTALHGLLVPVAAMLFLHPDGSSFTVGGEVLIGFVCLVSVALMRQILAYFDHVRVYRQLEEVTNALQDRVRVTKMRAILNPDDRFGVKDQRDTA